MATRVVPSDGPSDGPVRRNALDPPLRHAAYKSSAEYLAVLRQPPAHISAADLISALERMAAHHIPTQTDAKPASIYKDLCAIVWLLKRANRSIARFSRGI
jgi:hypothetical protein